MNRLLQILFVFLAFVTHNSFFASPQGPKYSKKNTNAFFEQLVEKKEKPSKKKKNKTNKNKKIAQNKKK